MMNGLFKNEVLRWQLAGAVFWQTLVASAIIIVYNCIRYPLAALFPLRALGAIFTISNWITLFSLLVALAPATAAHAAVLSTVEAPAKHHGAFQVLPTKVAAVLRKTAARITSPQTAAVWLAFFIAHALSALAILWMTLDRTRLHLCTSFLQVFFPFHKTLTFFLLFILCSVPPIAYFLPFHLPCLPLPHHLLVSRYSNFPNPPTPSLLQN